MRVFGLRLLGTAALLSGSILAVVVVSQTWQPQEIPALAVAAQTTTTTAPTSAPTTSAPTTQAPSTTGPPPTATSATDVAPGTVPSSTVPPTTAAPTTAAPTTVAPTAPVLDHQARGQAALNRISYQWQTRLPGWTIEFKPSRSGVLGYTYTSEQRIEVYVRDSMSDDLLAHVVAHELGHAVDVSLNNGEERRSWLAARGVPDNVWWPEEGGVSDFKSGAGDFAEGFAAWQIGTTSFRSKLGPAPNSAQLELMAALANN